MSERNNEEVKDKSFVVSPALIDWGIVSFVKAIIFCSYNTAPMYWELVSLQNPVQ